ncbi:MAG TPA: gliding motility lipoprotein GldH [Bacteroidales bacterium]|nr:gliding motility lipoprotein GldH [Bacteroidales bacterium]
MNKYTLLLLLCIALLTSCGPRKIYEKHYDIPRITWSRFDVRTFDVEIKDISASYDFYIAIRHHTEIPFKNIETKLTIYTPSGEMRMNEQKIVLRDNEGKLLGSGMGDLWDIKYLARKGLKFTEKGTCRVEISSTMSKADLPGIIQVGLIVEKGNSKR